MKNIFIVSLFLLSNVASSQTGAERELQKAINQVGEPCQKITQIFHSGNHNGSVMFSVACSGGQTYMVKVNRDGTGNVMSCRLMERLGLRCFVKL